MTRCKFKCTGVTKSLGWNPKEHGDFLYAAEFTAVTDNSPENKQFFAATPAGSLKVSTVRQDVFQPGKFYYLDITEIPATQD
jgi:hypothetical protein